MCVPAVLDGGGVSVAVLLMETSAEEVLLKSWVPKSTKKIGARTFKLNQSNHIVGNCGKATYSFLGPGLVPPEGEKPSS